MRQGDLFGKVPLGRVDRLGAERMLAHQRFVALVMCSQRGVQRFVSLSNARSAQSRWLDQSRSWRRFGLGEQRPAYQISRQGFVEQRPHQCWPRHLPIRSEPIHGCQDMLFDGDIELGHVSARLVDMRKHSALGGV
jgi:hypothetical protein